jgi:Zn-dependent peptidase ImmA (M78 family)/transcriptional regulator with XRE-family HTH domain
VEFNPAMLVLLRDVRGATQKEVADGAKLRQAYLSQIQSALRVPSAEAQERIAASLDVPVSLFSDPTPIRGSEAGDLHFRRRKTLPVGERKRLEGKLHLIYVMIRGLLRGIDYEPSLPLPMLDMDEREDPADAARMVRRLWRVPPGPIRNVTAYLEAAGMFLVEVTAPNKVDAVTRRGETGFHATALRRDAPADRDRLTRVHEAAHLIRHERTVGEDTEGDANAFAAEFLVPADEIEPYLYGITPRKLGQLKDLRLYWGVSLPFLVRHARRLECISERTEKYFYQVLNSEGLMYGSPDGGVPKEPPTLVSRIVATHRDEHGYSVAELASLAQMTPERFAAHFDLEMPNRLRLVH